MAQWVFRKANNQADIAERIYYSREFKLEGLEEFFNPQWDKHLFSPFLFKDMEKVVNRILTAISNNEKICIIGDYDADGVCATALFKSFFSFINHQEVYPLIPHRIKDGYGMTEKNVQQALDFGVKLIITVDNGISASGAVKFAKSQGADVIITDHHTPTEELPIAYGIINPKVPDSGYPFAGLCGAAVAYKVISALLGRLNIAGGENFLKWSLDLVAIATVADIMPLIGENRVLVHYGLKVLAQTRRPGLIKIIEKTKPGEMNARKIGFEIAPRINAAGRMEHADIAYKLLVSQSIEEAEELSEQLEKLNTNRRSMVTNAMKAVDSQVGKGYKSSDKIVIVKSDKWNPGIIGLIAARLAGKYFLPAVALSNYGDPDYYTASCRSIPQFDIADMIEKFKISFTKSGGHAQAGGFTIKATDLKVFEEQLYSYAQDNLGGKDLQEILEIDAEVFTNELTIETIDKISRLAPFGQGNPEPVLILRNAKIVEIRKVGATGSHLRLGIVKGQRKIFGIGFSLGELEKNFSLNDIVDVVFSLQKNEFNGRVSPQMFLYDLKKS